MPSASARARRARAISRGGVFQARACAFFQQNCRQPAPRSRQVDPDFFEIKRHAGRGTQLLFVGRVAAAKGLSILLEAVAKLDGVTLNIAGDGPDRALLEEMVEEIADRIVAHRKSTAEAGTVRAPKH